MSIVSKVAGSGVVKSFTSDFIDPSNYRTGDLVNNGWLFNQNGGIDRFFDFSGHNSSLKAYVKCPEVSAIINRKAQAFINGETFIMSTKGKAKGKESFSAEAVKIRNLLNNPNPLQNGEQFEAQTYIYHQLFGYSIILPIKPFGFPNYEATALWNIPPFMVDITETNKLFYENGTKVVEKIVLTYKGTRTVLNIDDLLIIKDFTPSFTSIFLPESRIKSQEMPINNIIGAYESRNVLINYRGSLGIISNDAKDLAGTVPMQQETKDQVQKDFLGYGLKSHQAKFIITNATVKWQQMGIPTKDLMLFEEVDADTRSLCNAYNYPFPLLQNEAGKLGGTDLKEYKKSLYQDTIIPESKSIYRSWNTWFKTDELGLFIENDFSHLPVLQEDALSNATARKTRNEALDIEFKNNLITLNRWLELNGEDAIDGDFGNKRYYELVALGWKFGTSSGATQNSQQPTAQQN